MDGHEREDVVEYGNKIFLPKLAEYHLDDATGNLTKIMPELEEGQLRIIAQFHDESCFHANDDAQAMLLEDDMNTAKDNLLLANITQGVQKNKHRSTEVCCKLATK